MGASKHLKENRTDLENKLLTLDVQDDIFEVIEVFDKKLEALRPFKANKSEMETVAQQISKLQDKINQFNHYTKAWELKNRVYINEPSVVDRESLIYYISKLDTDIDISNKRNVDRFVDGCVDRYHVFYFCSAL